MVQGPGGIRMGAAGMSKAEVGGAAEAATEEEWEEWERPFLVVFVFVLGAAAGPPPLRSRLAGEAAAADATRSFFEFSLLGLRG